MSETKSQEMIDVPAASSSAPEAKPVARRRPRRWAKFVLLLASTVTGLLLAEVGARLFVAITQRSLLIHSDERAGWALQPNLQDKIRAGDGGRFVISTDAEGHRITRRADEPVPEGSPTVLMVGDSFIMSTAADNHETFAWILAHEMPLNVVNLGVLGYGTDQELIRLEAYLDAHPTQDVRDVFVFVATNDFTDVQANYSYLGRTKPRFKITDGKLDRGVYHLTQSDRFMDVSYLYWLVNSQFASRLGGPAKDPAAGIDVVVACLDAMRDAVTRRGARFHVMVHHIRQISTLPDSAWADFNRRTGAFDMNERLAPPDGPDPIAYDKIHWNLAGHQRVAAIVKELILKSPVSKSKEHP